MYSNVVLYKYIHCDTGSYIKHKNDCRAKNVAEKYITRQTNKKEKKKKKTINTITNNFPYKFAIKTKRNAQPIPYL